MATTGVMSVGDMKLTAEQRKQKKKKKTRGGCYICIKQGHKIGECGSKRPCAHCGQVGNLHRSLCLQKFGADSREEAHLVEELPMEEDSSINENALLSSGEIVMMQTATAVISNPVNGQIKM